MCVSIAWGVGIVIADEGEELDKDLWAWDGMVHCSSSAFHTSAKNGMF